MYAEASKALRKLDEPQQEKGQKVAEQMEVDRKAMPAFTDMVNYINEKVIMDPYFDVLQWKDGVRKTFLRHTLCQT